MRRYAERALEKLGLSPCTDEEIEEGEVLMEDAMKVTTFYTISLMLAPVIETVVLLDRVLYLFEQGWSALFSRQNCVSWR